MGAYRGSGGAVFEMDVPEEGSEARRLFDQQIDKGDLVPVDSEPADDGLGSLKVDDLKALAADEGIDLGDATKKADIIEVIEAARNSEPADDSPEA